MSVFIVRRVARQYLRHRAFCLKLIRKAAAAGNLARAAERAGLDLAEMDAAIAADAGRLDGIIAASQEAQREGGHYGVPLMVFNGEPFFGQDRFDQLKWRMLQKGLAKRA